MRTIYALLILVVLVLVLRDDGRAGARKLGTATGAVFYEAMSTAFSVASGRPAPAPDRSSMAGDVGGVAAEFGRGVIYGVAGKAPPLSAEEKRDSIALAAFDGGNTKLAAAIAALALSGVPSDTIERLLNPSPTQNLARQKDAPPITRALSQLLNEETPDSVAEKVFRELERTSQLSIADAMLYYNALRKYPLVRPNLNQR